MDCECGCGASFKPKMVHGKSKRFVTGHNTPRSTRIVDRGYIMLRVVNHPRMKIGRGPGGYVAEHVLVVERAMGKPLPSNYPIHHFDENRSNNSNQNLVVCESTAYHCLLHSRQKALAACGNPDFRRCDICRKWDSLDSMSVYASTQRHRQCARDLYQQNRLAILARERAQYHDKKKEMEKK